jgi:hypothetical protein
MEIVQELEKGTHVVTPEEAPLYSICPTQDPARPFVLKKLGTGEKTCLTSLAATPQF